MKAHSGVPILSSLIVHVAMLKVGVFLLLFQIYYWPDTIGDGEVDDKADGHPCWKVLHIDVLQPEVGGEGEKQEEDAHAKSNWLERF